MLTPALLAEVYGVEAATGRDPLGHPTVTPLRSLKHPRPPTTLHA